MDLSLVILAAGLSSRYGGLKQLEGVGPGGETLLDYGIYDALRAGFTRVVVVTRREIADLLRDHIESTFGDSIPVSFVYQKLDELPAGFTAPVGRDKPWGTGHAVLTAKSELTGPFVVMNADDAYGAQAFAALAAHLQEVAQRPQPDFAAAGYRLRDTLSLFGGVSRGVCELDDAGYLRRVTELENIREEGGSLAGSTVSGEPWPLEGDETVSMNLWAATPAAFAMLEREFARFLGEHGEDRDAEFLLSTAVNDLIAAEEMRIRVIPVPGPWLGITFPQDQPHVVERIRELVEAGQYPRDLRGSMRGDRLV